LAKEFCNSVKDKKGDATLVLFDLSGSAFASALTPRAHYVACGVERFLMHCAAPKGLKKEN
jgi:hypothetical protein